MIKTNKKALIMLLYGDICIYYVLIPISYKMLYILFFKRPYITYHMPK